MRDLHNPSFSRRHFLAGAMAVPTTIAAPAIADAAGADDNFDELMLLLDLRAELLPVHEAAIRALDVIEADAGKPQFRAGVMLGPFLGRDHADRYYRGYGHVFLCADPDKVSFHDFFEEQVMFAVNRAKAYPDCADWPAVKARDYAKVTAEIARQIERRQRWEQESGYIEAEREVDHALEALCAVEEKIFSLPVKSLRDLRVKLDLVENEHVILDDRHLRLVFASIRSFAGGCAA